MVQYGEGDFGVKVKVNRTGKYETHWHQTRGEQDQTYRFMKRNKVAWSEVKKIRR